MMHTAAPAITAEDVEDFRRKMRKQRETNTPAKARERLIKAGILTKQGKPKWPVKEPLNTKKRISAKKGK